MAALFKLQEELSELLKKGEQMVKSLDLFLHDSVANGPQLELVCSQVTNSMMVVSPTTLHTKEECKHILELIDEEDQIIISSPEETLVSAKRMRSGED